MSHLLSVSPSLVVKAAPVPLSWVFNLCVEIVTPWIFTGVNSFTLLLLLLLLGRHLWFFKEELRLAHTDDIPNDNKK